MYANNETGTIFPIREIGKIAARKGVCFHCDAVQAVGKIPVNFREENISLLSISGHKLYAPKGIGALIVGKGTKFYPLLHGGSQERNLRSGTENMAGIVALGKACKLAEEKMSIESIRLRQLRSRLEEQILKTIPDVKRNGHPELRIPNTVNISFLGVASDALLTGRDRAGIAVSSGSACSSGSLKVSHVLKAMGIAAGAVVGNLRFSLGQDNDEEDVDYVVNTLRKLIQQLRRTTDA